VEPIKYYTSIFLIFFCSIIINSQNKNIFIFDPNGVSSDFQHTLTLLTEDPFVVADTIDESIYNFNGLFLFLNYPYTLTQEESSKLIQYTSDSKPVYIYSDLFSQSLDSIAFWNYIGVNERVDLLISVLVDSITGVDTAFTKGVHIDTSFMSGSVPMLAGNVDPILYVWGSGPDFNPTFISGYDTLKVIIDLYNLISKESFLEKVLQYFELIPFPQNVQIQFYPNSDTAYVNGGASAPEYLCKNLVSTNERDSITLEPGPYTYFYYDSLGHLIQTDNFYFIVVDSFDEYDYELWLYPKTYPPFDPVLIEFDSLIYSYQNDFDIELIVKKQGVKIDSLVQPFHADYGLSVDDEGNIPNEFNLYQNYPNPFNPTTKIKFKIPDVIASVAKQSLMVTLKVYNILGNEITTLVNEQSATGGDGEYEIEFNGNNLPSGIYFYQLKAGSYIETKKMLLIK